VSDATIVNTILGISPAAAAGAILMPTGSSRLPFEPEPGPVAIIPNFPPVYLNWFGNLGPIPVTTRNILGAFTFNLMEPPNPNGYVPLAYSIDRQSRSSLGFSILGAGIPLLGVGALPTPAFVVTATDTSGAAMFLRFYIPDIIGIGDSTFTTVLVFLQNIGKYFSLTAAIGEQGSVPTVIPPSSIITTLNGVLQPFGSIPAFDIPLRTLPGNNIGLSYGSGQLVTSIETAVSPYAPASDPARYSVPGLLAQSLVINDPNVADLSTVLTNGSVIDGASSLVPLPPNGMVFPGSQYPPIMMLSGGVDAVTAYTPSPVGLTPGSYGFHLGDNQPFSDFPNPLNTNVNANSTYSTPGQTVDFQGNPVYYSSPQDPSNNANVIIENIEIDPGNP
jgi:hypothetical protein